MTKEKPKDVAASVRGRLTNLARNRNEELQTVLTRYAIERFLYRLSVSRHSETFILKGATLFQLWAAEPHRGTKDVDLLGTGDDSLEGLTEVMIAICTVAVPEDGLRFDTTAISADRIKEDQVYEGVRVTCPVRLGNARLRLQIDVGFGDAVTPPPVPMKFPTILDFPAAILKTYPRETVVAEKFHAVTTLGMRNSRMKDFFDLWILSHKFPFDGETLVRAIAATFRRRESLPPTETPLALTIEFGADPTKMTQWKAFVHKGKLSAEPVKLEAVISDLESFLMPPSRAATGGEMFAATWEPGGSWKMRISKES